MCHLDSRRVRLMRFDFCQVADRDREQGHGPHVHIHQHLPRRNRRARGSRGRVRPPEQPVVRFMCISIFMSEGKKNNGKYWLWYWLWCCMWYR
jgi:hypothetical protein